LRGAAQDLLPRRGAEQDLFVRHGVPPEWLPMARLLPYGELQEYADEAVPYNRHMHDWSFDFLRRQIVGIDSAFDTPFGRRLMVYCDYTASGAA
jgi:hypothetical protein